VRLVVETVTAGVPAPLRGTICGLFTALSVKVSEPASVPNVEGANATAAVHVVPALMLAPQVLLTRVKFALAAMLEKLSAEFFKFVRVTDWLALMLPTTPFPKLKLLVETVTGTIPVPVRLAVCGLLTELSLTVSVPVAAPSDVGANAMRMVQELPAATEVGDSEQVPPICKKSPVTAMLLIVSGTVWRFVRVSVWVELVVP
jgi:hypothetical protein